MTLQDLVTTEEISKKLQEAGVTSKSIFTYLAQDGLPAKLLIASGESDPKLTPAYTSQELKELILEAGHPEGLLDILNLGGGWGWYDHIDQKAFVLADNEADATAQVLMQILLINKKLDSLE